MTRVHGPTSRVLLLLGVICGLLGPASAEDTNAPAENANTAANTEMIVGGEEAQEGQFPWQVLLDIHDRATGYYNCSGSFVSNQWVLTAAHCVDFDNVPEVVVGYGSIDRKRTHNVAAEKVIKFDGFSGLPAKNDLALIKLKQPVPNSPVIKLADAASDQALVVPGRKLTVSGWGVTWDFEIVKNFNEAYGDLKSKYNALVDKYNALVSRPECAGSIAQAGTRSGGRVPEVGEIESPQKLRFVDVKSIDNASCSQAYEAAGLNAIGANEICATGPKGAKDACFGDSGGPLVVQTNEGGYLQVGIVGGGVQCGNPTMPGTYARVASFTDWINTTMKNN
jgi:secreted trypsin-like serine protease